MIQEAIKGLWAANNRAMASKALDCIESCLERDSERLSDIEFSSLMKLIRVKSRLLSS